MTLRYMLLAETVVLEMRDNAPTAVNILDSIDMAVTPPAPSAEGKYALMPVRFALLALWVAEEGDINESVPFDLLMSCGDRVVKLHSEPFAANFRESSRQFTRVTMPAIPFLGFGEYRFTLQWKQGEVTRQETWPLAVNSPRS